MQQFVAGLLELLGRRGDGCRVGNIELDADLRDGALGRPLGAPEARLGRLGKWPDAEML